MFCYAMLCYVMLCYINKSNKNKIIDIISVLFVFRVSNKFNSNIIMESYMFGNIPTDSYTNNQTNFEISKLFTNLYKEKRDKHNFIFSEYMSLHQYVKYIDWYEIFFDPLFSYQLYEYIVVHSLAYAILSKYILISNYRSEKICVFIIENEKMPYYKLLEYAEPLAQRKGPKNEIFKSIFKLYSDSLTIEFLDLCLTHDIVLNCFNVMHDSFIEYYFKNNDCTTEELIEIIDRNNF